MPKPLDGVTFIVAPFRKISKWFLGYKVFAVIRHLLLHFYLPCADFVSANSLAFRVIADTRFRFSNRALLYLVGNNF